ncbi:hypothetical protein AWW66_17710 [Micromonospora rosaria]|uniref:Secreted protein n=1 Tax=Micromonospora rosaria TaxID=47874 RepID=A0A136PQD5_9ACTN|nr:hypothetical protein AWW66_17710 [Micromonospora rosaria]
MLMRAAVLSVLSPRALALGSPVFSGPAGSGSALCHGGLMTRTTQLDSGAHTDLASGSGDARASHWLTVMEMFDRFHVLTVGKMGTDRNSG